MLTNQPIFIGGDHRSGTTLLSIMLNAHPALVMGPEIDFLEPQNLGTYVLECCALLTKNDPRVKGEGVNTAEPHWQKGVQFVRQCQRFGLGVESLVEVIQNCVQQLGRDPELFSDRCLVLDCIGNYRRQDNNTLKWGIKIQRNILLLEQFLEFWQNAVFIHLIRDGRDVAASHIRSHWDWAYRAIDEAAWGWSSIVNHSALQCRPQLIELKYEDLILNPLDCLRNLLARLDLSWDDAVLKYWEREQPLFENPFNHPSANAANNPPYKGAISRYQKDLSEAEIAVFEKIASAALSRYGYLDNNQ